MPSPKLPDQILGAKPMTLKTAAHRQTTQRHRRRNDLVKGLSKCLDAAWCGVDLQRIRPQLGQHPGQILQADPMI